jgi:DNA-binding XRE family transcriptional regulator
MLREVREKKGVTINELARKSGVSRHTINEIEKHDYQRTKPTTWYKLANALEVDVEKIKN